MNCNFQSNSLPSSRRSPSQIIEDLQARSGWQATPTTGTDYFSRHETRLSVLRGGVGDFDPGAIALNTKDKEINLKAVAPAAHSETAAKGVFYTSLGIEEAAASPGEPALKTPAASLGCAKHEDVEAALRSANDEKSSNSKDTATNYPADPGRPPVPVPAPAPLPVGPHTPPSTVSILFMPNR